jgi:membrane protease YdiL (CAAX protease family)
MKHLMNYHFVWQKTDLYTSLPIVISIIVFVIYWFTSQSNQIRNWYFNKYEFDKASVYHNIFIWIFGFLMLGLIPLLVSLLLLTDYTLADFGLSFKPDTSLFTIGWTFALSSIIVPLCLMSARKPKNQINYPHIRSRNWSLNTFLSNALGLALYLFGYEILFRGILLFPLANILGVWPAIAINTAMYTSTHIPKGLEESVGAFLLGLVLCILTLVSGTIWIAVLVHIILSWSNSFAALKFHPQMTLKLK